MKKGLAIGFPGTGYTCRERLFAMLFERYSAAGYDILPLDYSHIPFKEIDALDEAARLAFDSACEQLKGIRSGEYSDTVFISKSLGTLVAARYARESSLSPAQLFLTPVPEALPYIDMDMRVLGMVIGDMDRVMDHREVERFCAPRNIPFIIACGVGHSLKYDRDAATAELNRRIALMCRPL